MAKTMNLAAVSMAAEELGCDERYLTSEPVTNEFFSRWTIWKVTNGAMPPRIMYIATDGLLAQPLADVTDFSTLVASEPLHLDGNDAVMQYVRLCISTAMRGYRVLERAEDIPGISPGDLQTWRGRIATPRIWRANDTYNAEVWLWRQGALSMGTFSVNASGHIDLQLDKAADQVGTVRRLR
jgi:hypothetical protein